MRIFAVAALAALTVLAGCAGTANTPGASDNTLPYTGDQKGGRIPNGFDNVPAAMNTAQVHCAKFNKKAIVTEMNTAAAGGVVAFQCL